MKYQIPLAPLWRSQTGSTLVEFGFLAPVLIGLMLGLMGIGVMMKDYNAMRSASAEAARYAVIEYQKANLLSSTQIKDVAASIAAGPGYGLHGDRLDVSVNEEASPVAGAKKFAMTLSYEPFSPAAAFGLRAPQLEYEQNIYVRDAPGS